jgi:hypothetical protein
MKVQNHDAGEIHVMWGLKHIWFWEPSLKKECKIRYRSAYVFRMKEGTRTNYKSKKAYKYHKHHKI